MNTPRLLACFAAAAVLLAAGPATAQDTVSSAGSTPAHVSVISGQAVIVREGQSEPAAASMPLLEGDTLRTDDGRLEVLLPDGSLIHLDAYTTVDLLSGALLRLSSGRLILVISGRPDERPSLDYQVDARPASVRILTPGDYRISIVAGRDEPNLEVAVVRGEAVLFNDHGAVNVRAGECSVADENYAPAQVRPFNSARADAFVRWSNDQREARLGYTSQRYLPAEVRVYAGAFDRYGSWEYEQPYGYIWYPRVEVGWRPYYHGYWRPIGLFGWTWIGYDPWSWPTHHYGRWGFGVRGWYWIPGRVWGPAWVSWGVSASYVSWCPLGWNDAPVFSLTVFNTYVSGRHYDPWTGWTIVPRHAFGSTRVVATVAVAGRSLGPGAHATFVVQRTAPAVPRVSVSRVLGGSRVVGPVTGRAVPRSSVGSPLSPAGAGDFRSLDRRTTAAAPFTGSPELRSRPDSRDRPTGGLPGTAAQRAPQGMMRSPGVETSTRVAPQPGAPGRGNDSMGTRGFALPRSQDAPRSVREDPAGPARRAPATDSNRRTTGSSLPYPREYQSAVPPGFVREAPPAALRQTVPDRGASTTPRLAVPRRSDDQGLRSSGYSQAPSRPLRAPDRSTSPFGYIRREGPTAAVPRAPDRSVNVPERPQAAPWRAPDTSRYERSAPAPPPFSASRPSALPAARQPAGITRSAPPSSAPSRAVPRSSSSAGNQGSSAPPRRGRSGR